MPYDLDLDLDLYGDGATVPALDAFHDDVDDPDPDASGVYDAVETEEDLDDADTWLFEHMSDDGPTAEGFRLLGEMEDNGDFV